MAVAPLRATRSMRCVRSFGRWGSTTRFTTSHTEAIGSTGKAKSPSAVLKRAIAYVLGLVAKVDHKRELEKGACHDGPRGVGIILEAGLAYPAIATQPGAAHSPRGRDVVHLRPRRRAAGIGAGARVVLGHVLTLARLSPPAAGRLGSALVRAFSPGGAGGAAARSSFLSQAQLISVSSAPRPAVESGPRAVLVLRWWQLGCCRVFRR